MAAIEYTITYPDALHSLDPSIRFNTLDDSGTYESIVMEDGHILPPKDDLDVWIHKLRESFMEDLIKAERDVRKGRGVKVGSKWFHTDDTSRIQQLGLVLMGANIPPNLMWKTMDKSFVLMTQTLASQIFAAVAQLDSQIFGVAEQHIAAMRLESNPLEYNYSGGWPLAFGE